MINLPEKKTFVCEGEVDDYKHGFNQACEEWEAYHKAETIALLKKHNKQLDKADTYWQAKLENYESVNALKAKEQYQQKWDIINSQKAKLKEVLLSFKDDRWKKEMMADGKYNEGFLAGIEFMNQEIDQAIKENCGGV